MNQKVLLLLAFALVLANARLGATPTKLRLLENAKRAKCLDGTAPGYYYSKGSDEGKDKVIIFLEGGFYCHGETREEILQSCYERSTTDLGSSSNWGQTYNDSGFFNQNIEKNPLFYNWNRIFIRYCDGTYYQSSAEPIVFKDKTLYFRGNDNMREIIDDIAQNFGLLNSSTVVFAGGSAGGQGAYFWAQYIRNYLPKSIKMIASPDCGFNVELNKTLQNKNPVWVDLITEGKREIIQPQGCPYLYDDANLYKCFFTEYLVDIIDVPMFFISSLYDQFFINTYLGIDCIDSNNALVGCSNTDLIRIEDMRQKMLNLISKIRTEKSDWGMWAVSCVLHVFSQRTAYDNFVYQVPENSSITPALALKAFVEAVEQGKPLDNNYYFIDEAVYPNNTRCNGLAQAHSS